MRIAAVISSHGFGHAARACAVINCLRIRYPDLEFELFTEVPEWFFIDSLQSGFHYTYYSSDVGLIQRTPFAEDLPETVNRVMRLLLSLPRIADDLGKILIQKSCRLVICDISPTGIQAARKAGIQSLLIENFTWDWIYAGYDDFEPRFKMISPQLKSIFDSADYHIQAEPICAPRRCDMVARPVSRQPRQPREITREKLGIEPDTKMVLITSGGIEQKYPGIEKLIYSQAEVHFVIPGGASHVEQQANLTLLPHHSDFYHPDLVSASDAVVGKLGYSTVAEVFHAGIPYGYVPRDHFRESEPLASFVLNNMGGIEIPSSDFQSGEWIKILPNLIDRPRQNRSASNGADEIAQFIYRILGLI